MFAELAYKIEKDLETKDNKELDEIISEAKTVTSKNCSGGAYRVAQTVIENAEFIKEDRTM